MLFGVAFFALFLGFAVSAPWYAETPRHQTGLNPLLQGRSSLTQGFLCDYCVVGVEDAQAALRENLDQILGVLNRTSQLCAYCPVSDQCSDFFLNEIPQAIQDVLAMTPNDICSDAGLCDENATLPGMVMSNLNGNVARDRVIKRMLMRARVMQQKMIRLILGEDYLCTACQDFLTTMRDMLLNNETQNEVVEFLSPLCSYMPSEYQAECTDFVQSLPALMTMVADDVLVDSTCAELGFCNATKKPVAEPGLPDILNQLGLPGILPVLGNGQNQNPFQFPSGGDRQTPFQFPDLGQGRPNQNPFGLPSIPGMQNPFGSPSKPGKGRPGQYPFEHPSPQSRPQSPLGKWPTSSNTRPAIKPQRPKPKPTPEPEVPGLNLDDIFGGINTGIRDRMPSLPEMPEMPDIRIPGLSIRMPGSRRNGNRGRQGRGRRMRSLPDWKDVNWKDIETLAVPKDKVHEYIPDPIPDDGLIITEEKGSEESCEICQVAVGAVDAWLEENAPELQKMISKVVQPFCQAFPSPMKEDCVTDVADFVSVFIQTLVSKLQPEPVCKWLKVCPETATEDVPGALPTTEIGLEPTTWPLFP